MVTESKKSVSAHLYRSPLQQSCSDKSLKKREEGVATDEETNGNQSFKILHVTFHCLLFMLISTKVFHVEATSNPVQQQKQLFVLSSNTTIESHLTPTSNNVLSFSFRTCEQSSPLITLFSNDVSTILTINNGNQLDVLVDSNNNAKVEPKEKSVSLHSKEENGFSNSKWHTIQFRTLKIDDLNSFHSLEVSIYNENGLVDRQRVSSSLTTHPLTSSTEKWRISGFVGCLTTGLGLDFNPQKITSSRSDGAVWSDACLLPSTCSTVKELLVQSKGTEESCNANKACKSNGGTCFGNRCLCRPGFTGLNCSEKMLSESAEPCSDFTCFNGATCDNVSGSGCTCPPSFSGRQCEKVSPSMSPCGLQCLNGGVCDTILYSNVNHCICPPEFHGNLCQMPTDAFQKDKKRVAVASPLRTGPTDPASDPCMNAEDDLPICKNNATCVVVGISEENNPVDSPASIVCECPSSDFIGERCEIFDCRRRRKKSDVEAGGLIWSSTNDPTNSQSSSDVGGGCPEHNLCSNQADINGQFCICREDFRRDAVDGPCFQKNDCRLSENACSSDTTSCQPQSKTFHSCGRSCGSNFCFNNAFCEDPSLSLCGCVNDFYGSSCQYSPETTFERRLNDDQFPCSQNSCDNGGTCFQDGLELKCSCLDGWTGRRCETPTDRSSSGGALVTCDGNPCQNGAKCLSVEDNYRCECVEGFSGTFCEINMNECDPNPCDNGGICVDKINDYTCNCPSSFAGKNCHLPSPCVTSPCHESAVCETQESINGEITFKCRCAKGFEGVRCDINVDDCVGVQCRDPEAPTCVDLVDGYKCSCLSPQVGPNGTATTFCNDLAEIEVDKCVTNPCHNDGSCESDPSTQDGYVCDCPKGWAGSTCAEDIDECSIDVDICGNGICRNKPGGYACWCRPGFTGSHCDHDFDECLSDPCVNGATCSDLINAYFCDCLPGFTGKSCEINIDECDVGPCMNGGECIDGINNYTCNCVPGFEGQDCQVNINECQDEPCENGGICNDLVNAYSCNCDGTGFQGKHCETNINECDPLPCKHNSTCSDLINDFSCSCYDGYRDKDCATDISDCESDPCFNDGLCLEKSNASLYTKSRRSEDLDVNFVKRLRTSPHGHVVRAFFDREFSYENASGYVCSCQPGYEGDNCEINIDECASKPCIFGDCIDGINGYDCACNEGYDGLNCDHEIDECTLLNPCFKGECSDRIADYECKCDPGWGGKNCSVELTGCQDVTCLNSGTCIPWLIGEDDHRANCSCTSGFDGLRCESRTTFSFNGKSYIKVPSNRKEGYELQLKFRTTLANGLVAIGQGNTHFSLQLLNGGLNLYSNLISKYEGISIGQNLNDINWVKVYVAVNSSHLTLGVNDRLQATQPINPTDENDTVFYNTFVGGIVKNQLILANNAPSLIGCIRDITVNSYRVTEKDFIEIPDIIDDTGIISETAGLGFGNLGEGLVDNGSEVRNEEDVLEQVNTKPGCDRVEQCNPNPCGNDGKCTDLWIDFQCSCHRPFLGPTCQYSFNSATFGFENITNSIAVVNIDDPEPYRLGVDISMFIRTREQNGFIFYFGSDLLDEGFAMSYITCQMLLGKLVVQVFFDGNVEKSQVYTVNLNDGYRHLIRVIRMNNSMRVQVNESIYINHEIPSPHTFFGQKMYLGNFPTPQELSDMNSIESDDKKEENDINQTVVEVNTDNEKEFQDFNKIAESRSSSIVNSFDEIQESSDSESDVDNQIETGGSVGSSDNFSSQQSKVFDEQPRAILVDNDGDQIGAGSIDVDEDGDLSLSNNEVITKNVRNKDSIRRRRRQILETEKSLGEESSILEIDPNKKSSSLDGKRIKDSPTSPKTNPTSPRPHHFKGVIQDVQITDGNNMTRIVELFPDSSNIFTTADSVVSMGNLKSIGDVALINVKKGVVSDNTCVSDPCKNGASCQITWNDYICQCSPGYKGRNCDQIEYCYWYTCPFGSECNSLPDGHECITNATFNGVNSTINYLIGELPEIIYSHNINPSTPKVGLVDDFGTISSNNVNLKAIEMKFRSNQAGTVLQIVQSVTNIVVLDVKLRGDGSLTLNMLRQVKSSNAAGTSSNSTINLIEDVFIFQYSHQDDAVNILDGEWHLIELRFGLINKWPVFGKVDNQLLFTKLTRGDESSSMSDSEASTAIEDYQNVEWMELFLLEGNRIHVGASVHLPNAEDPHFSSSSPSDASYTTISDDFKNAEKERISFKTLDDDENKQTSSFIDHFNGCLGEIRISSILLPFLAPSELVNNTAEIRFDVIEKLNVDVGKECTLCYNEQCQNGAVCKSNLTSFDCECPQGFTDMYCSTNVDECEISHECVHGICLDGIATYSCACDAGYAGNFCDEDFDECVTHPCLNEGRCFQNLDVPGAYTCQCTDEFEGSNCEERKVKTCETDMPCQNGARCRTGRREGSDDLYICECRTAYKGVNCEIKKDFCEENMYPCTNGATCKSIESTLSYKCLCPPGYEGVHCETETNECAYEPCLHSGQCIDRINDFVCNCSDTGYEGIICENNINECETGLSLCSTEYGSCYDTQGGYECICDEQYCGSLCQHKSLCLMENASDLLCSGHGDCIDHCDTEPYYVCECLPGWTGQKCDQKARFRGTKEQVLLIVGPIIGAVLIISAIGFLIFILMARQKRKSEGKYKPASQELTSPRLQLDNMMKPPPEERLI